MSNILIGRTGQMIVVDILEVPVSIGARLLHEVGRGYNTSKSNSCLHRQGVNKVMCYIWPT